MLVSIKKMFMGLLINVDNVSNHKKCILLSSQKCQIQLTFTNLHPNEYNQQLNYYTFTAKLDKYVGGCNRPMIYLTKYVFQIKQDLNINVFNMLTGINESKTLTKHISCKYKCKSYGTNCDSNQWWHNDKCQCECKKCHVCEKDYVWNPATCNCENGNI